MNKDYYQSYHLYKLKGQLTSAESKLAQYEADGCSDTVLAHQMVNIFELRSELSKFSKYLIKQDEIERGELLD